LLLAALPIDGRLRGRCGQPVRSDLHLYIFPIDEHATR